MLNRTTTIGRLTKDPEIKMSTGGKRVCSFTLAVDKDYSGRDGKRETDFFPFEAWEGNAEFIGKNFKKGNIVGIEGSITPKEYTDKDEIKHKSFVIKVKNAFFTENAPKKVPESEE